MGETIVVTRDCGDVPVSVRLALKNWLEQELGANGTTGTVVLKTVGVTFQFLPKVTQS